MLTKADAIYFIDPIQDTCIPTERVFVLKEYYGRQRHLHQVRPVAKERFHNRGILWWIDEESRDYLYGAPIGTTTSEYKRVIAFEDDVVILGEASSIYRTNTHITISDVRRSDQQVVPETYESGVRGSRAVVSDWMTAAPWARELFPMPDDDDETVALKLTIAKEKHRQRVAHRTIFEESATRGWDEHLGEVREKTSYLPTPNFGAYVTGSAIINVEGTLSETDLAPKVEALKNRAISIGTAIPAATVRVDYIAAANWDSSEKIRNMSSNHATSYARDTFGDYSLRIGDFESQPALRGATA